MKFNLGLKIFSVAACLTVWGCMSVSQDSSQDQKSEAARNASAVKFVSETGISAAKFAGVTQTSQIDDPDQFADMLEEFGCPDLANVFRDLNDMTTDELPASVKKQLKCFGISGSGSVDDIDSISAKLEDFESVLDCICGGSALSDAFNSQKWSAFSAATASAAGAAFSASTSAAAGSGFDASSSNAGGSGFNAGTSSAAGSGYSAE
jgi:hypothetical protein